MIPKKKSRRRRKKSVRREIGLLLWTLPKRSSKRRKTQRRLFPSTARNLMTS
jgi:hypothetical protein